MLPPVRATSSVSPDYPVQVPQLTSRPRLDLAGMHAHDAAYDMPLSGGRLNLLSLSGQLQLAQGSSIFAETIGTLLDMPRGDGEPLADYAKRLTAAVQAMPAGERAVLERMLNQLVKGVSIRLLAEILNNPTGPEAARLAMSMEAAQSSGLDLATTAVVSSYRQNGGEVPARGVAKQTQIPAAVVTNGNGSGPQASQSSQAVPVSPPASALPPTSTVGEQGTDGFHPITPIVDAFVETGSSGGAGQAGTGPADVAVAVQNNLAQRVDIDEGAGAEADVQEAAVADDGTARPAEAAIRKPAGDAPVAAANAGSASRTILHPATQPGNPHAGPGTSADHHVLPTKPANNTEAMPVASRQVAAERHEGSDNVRSQRLHGQQIPPALAEWLAEVFATDLYNDAALSTLRESPAETPLDEVLRRLFGRSPTPDAAPDSVARPVLRPADGQAANATPPSAETAAVAEDLPVHATANPKLVATDTADQIEARSMPMLPVPIMRDAVPLAYVPYPPAEEEREREERKAKQIEAIGEDKEDEQPADQSFQHHEEQPDEDASEAEDGEAEDADLETEGGGANDLYWRMAGWA